ncbi:MAG: ABC transporter permease [Cyclobacteriaceae bacterium]
MSVKKNNTTPPAWIDSLIEGLAPIDLAEEIKGDLLEIFQNDLEQKSISRSKINYALNGLGFLTKSFFWRKRTSNNSNPFIMLNSYLKMARRSLLAYKGNTTINVIGLVIGIASALVIFTVIRYELSFDSFHSDANNIYRMVRVTGTGFAITENSECRTGVSYPVPDAIKEESTALDKITTVLLHGSMLIEVPNKAGEVISRFNESYGCALIEPSFFSVFDFKGTAFKWINGSPSASLEKPFSVVLTKTTASRYFPDGNAMGMTLKIDKNTTCTVTGIVEDFPDNSDFPFTVLVSYSTLRALAPRFHQDWISVDDNNCTFVVPAKGLSIPEVEQAIAKVHEKHTSKDIHESRHYLLQPLKEMHFDARFGNFNGRTISHNTILALGIIGLFLLLTGCINYINLATAQSTMRSKEIGLRKVMGSERKNLVAQFLTETFLVVFIAGIIALGVSELLLFNLQSLLNLKPDLFYFTDPVVIGSLLLIIFFVTLFAGLYPSLQISKFNPVTSLKNRFSTETIGGFSLRKVLVVAQFTITQILVVATFVVVMQMQFFQNSDLGFVHEAIVNVNIPNSDQVKREALEQNLRSQAFVSQVSCSYSLPSGKIAADLTVTFQKWEPLRMMIIKSTSTTLLTPLF